jgi:hypothetical protein
MAEPTTPPPVQTQYYLLEGARKPVAGIEFQPFDIIGSVLWGIYATDKPAEIEALDKEASNPKVGLSKITYDEFLPMAQKKIPNFVNSNQFQPRPVVTQPKESASPTPPLQPPLPPIKGSGAVVVDSPAPPPEPEVVSVAPVASVQEALSIGEVAASPTNPPRASRKSSKPAPAQNPVL